MFVTFLSGITAPLDHHIDPHENMKTFTALYYYRSNNGSLESTFVDISAKSKAEATRIAKSRVGGKETTRLVYV